jgi:hypothetical protein
MHLLRCKCGDAQSLTSPSEALLLEPSRIQLPTKQFPIAPNSGATKKPFRFKGWRCETPGP